MGRRITGGELLARAEVTAIEGVHVESKMPFAIAIIREEGEEKQDTTLKRYILSGHHTYVNIWR